MYRDALRGGSRVLEKGVSKSKFIILPHKRCTHIQYSARKSYKFT